MMPHDGDCVTVWDAASGSLFTTSVRGMKYNRKEGAMNLKIGDILQLVREPGNTHDSNAIEVTLTNEGRIGYVSKDVARHLAPGMDDWGGRWQAKVSQIQKQAPPHTWIAVEICFPLPPGVTIPAELDEVAQWSDNPFDTPRPTAVPQTHAPPPSPHSVTHEPLPLTPKPAPVMPDVYPIMPTDLLTEDQLQILDFLEDARIKSMITILYGNHQIPWPTFGIEGFSSGMCNESMIEVGWPDYKVGIAFPGDITGHFIRTGWKIYPSESLTDEQLRTAFST
jgi:hypothetical protein